MSNVVTEAVQDPLLGHRVTQDLLWNQGLQSFNSRLSHRLVRQCAIVDGLKWHWSILSA